jgi:ribosomal-protein-alanine N-acetyltransferase
MPQDDVDRIMAVMVAAFDPAYGEAWTRGQIESALVIGSCQYWLITPDGTVPDEDDEVAGFALLRRTLDEAELLLFAVSPQWRRRGLGAKLLARTMADTKNAGTTRVMLEMRRGNPAQHLYQSYGFAAVGIRPKYYRAIDGKYMDALTFSCTLD